MKKYINGEYIEMTAEEVAAIETQMKEAKIHELTRPRTMEEGSLELQKAILVEKMEASEDKTLAIACMAFFDAWTPGVYSVGDVRTDPETGYPRECILNHDSTTNAAWTIKTATLWKPYHSRKKEYALPWEQPTGAHDIYKVGEYMVWTDYSIYKCIADTNYNPVEYADAWVQV